MITENQIAKLAFDASLKVHKVLGPGLLESAYEECLFYELSKSSLYVEKQAPIPLIYENIKMDVSFRADIIVERKFIIEVKAVDTLHDVHTAQLHTYLKVSGCKLGFLINFNVLLLKDGIRRVINGALE